MCVVCGCNNAEDHGAHEHAAPVALDPSSGDLHYGAVPGLSQARTVKLEADVLGANQRLADRNRAHFTAHGVTAYNLMSSPGAGKTTLLCATIEALRRRAPELPLAVIEGDQQTRLDAERIRAAGAPAIQVNTGRGCHLDAQMVGDAFARLDLHAQAHPHGHRHEHAHEHTREHHGPEALLFIENVGNLVCPALWDLGEAAKVVILSVTEGDDKPLKYPDMFAAATLMVINKIDLLPYVNFDVAKCIEYARRVNPRIAVLQLSATRGEGMQTWLDWLLREDAALQERP
ncbi:MAG TPA: hydrogenase accessory protein HypB [Polaromonas sp.]|uniref:hydrogenase nickel incorporation protein HypB n=1 Tax=Polaromonas sp. UBA4122 TaxID=1947074 RepID=UPI000EE6D046|nr:hydrogenase nickel incorporation protein HypB [Polaromonas sp. UBA4122]HAL40352.1 hydrogenase accessory protein HypB [Polaromonas sp.]